MKVIENEFFNQTGLGLPIPEFSDFEDRIFEMDAGAVRPALKKVQKLSAKLRAEDNCVYSDVEIVIGYLQKMVAVLDGFTDKNLFRDINMEIINYSRSFPEVTSKNLIEVLLTSGVSLRSDNEPRNI